MLSARFASVLRRMLLSASPRCGRGFAVNPSYAPRSKIGYRARRSVGISSAQAPRFAVRNHQSQGGERDQGERILSQHRGLQVRHGILSHPAHADGSAEAWPRLQTHGGRRRHRRRCAWGARDICRYGSSSVRTRSRSLPTSPTTPTPNPPFRLVKSGCSAGLAPRSNARSRNAFGTTAAHSTRQWHQARDAKGDPDLRGSYVDTGRLRDRRRVETLRVTGLTELSRFPSGPAAARGLFLKLGLPALIRAHGRHVRLHSGRSFGRDTKGSNNEPHELPIKIPATNTSTPPTMT